MARQGIRVGDLISNDFEKMYKETLKIKNEQIRTYGGKVFDIEKSYEEYKNLLMK